MMEHDHAQIGDKVLVWWDESGTISGTVSYIPCATGDSWVIVEDDGSILHVGLFQGLRVLSRKAGIAPDKPAPVTQEQVRGWLDKWLKGSNRVWLEGLELCDATLDSLAAFLAEKIGGRDGK